MNARAISIAAAVLILSPFTARCADLTKMNRQIAKEPAYQTQSPKYCLLVFGPEAKTRVWLVQDGDVLYVDHNANGDLTEKSKRITVKQKGKDYRTFEPMGIRDGSLKHTELTVSQMLVSADSVDNDKEFERIKSHGTQPWTWWIRINAERPASDTRPLPKRIGYLVNGDSSGYLVFGNRPEEAPIVHFNGPWTFALQDMKQRFRPGHSSMLQVGVGTPGVGPGTFTWVLYANTIPADAYPLARLSFPPKQAGGKPLEQTMMFKRRC